MSCKNYMNSFARKIIFPGPAEKLLFLFSALVLVMTDHTQAQSYWHGTTIAIVKINEEIVVGADSKERGGGGALGNDRLGCKIKQVGTLFFTTLGLTAYTTTRFSIDEVVAKALGTPGALSAKVYAFEKIIGDPIALAAQTIYRTQRREFDAHFRDKNGLAVLFFGVEKEVVSLYVRQFLFSVTVDDRVIVTPVRDDCLAGCQIREIFGHKQAIVAYLAKNPGFKRETFADEVRDLIAVEISSGNLEVGFPIDIVRLTKNKIEWVQKKDACR